MEDAKGLVRHVLLVKFKDGVPPDEIENLIKRVKDVSIKNKHEGFTHVFESTFASTEAIKEYLDHLEHVEFAKSLKAALDKIIVVDY